MSVGAPAVPFLFQRVRGLLSRGISRRPRRQSWSNSGLWYWQSWRRRRFCSRSRREASPGPARALSRVAPPPPRATRDLARSPLLQQPDALKLLRPWALSHTEAPKAALRALGTAAGQDLLAANVHRAVPWIAARHRRRTTEWPKGEGIHCGIVRRIRQELIDLVAALPCLGDMDVLPRADGIRRVGRVGDDESHACGVPAYAQACNVRTEPCSSRIVALGEVSSRVCASDVADGNPLPVVIRSERDAPGALGQPAVRACLGSDADRAEEGVARSRGRWTDGRDEVAAVGPDEMERVEALSDRGHRDPRVRAGGSERVRRACDGNADPCSVAVDVQARDVCVEADVRARNSLREMSLCRCSGGWRSNVARRDPLPTLDDRREELRAVDDRSGTLGEPAPRGCKCLAWEAEHR